MNKTIKHGKLIALALTAGLILAPVAAYAATEDTIITANISSTISLTTLGNVSIGVLPDAGGRQSSASDTVTVTTNDTQGYNLTLHDFDTDTNLVSGSNNIPAHAGTNAAPTVLANNTWGYAIAGGSFDASYSALTNATTSATKWAGIPASGGPANIIKTTAAPAVADLTTVWYSLKVDASKPDGNYVDTVVYTATAN